VLLIFFELNCLFVSKSVDTNFLTINRITTPTSVVQRTT